MRQEKAPVILLKPDSVVHITQKKLHCRIKGIRQSDSQIVMFSSNRVDHFKIFTVSGFIVKSVNFGDIGIVFKNRSIPWTSQDMNLRPGEELIHYLTDRS